MQDERSVLPPTSRLKETFSALQERDFRVLWSGALLSTTGTWMQTVAQSWLVLTLTGSAFYLGVDSFLATFPIILFSLFGGVVADRVERRKILLASQYFQLTFAFVLAALIYFEVVRVWHIFVLSFLTGTVQSFGGPAYQALLPTLVRREHVPNAIALNSMQFNLARMIGPVLAGLALTSLGAAACFGLNGLSFLPVILSLLIIRPGAPNSDGRKQGAVLDELRDGLRYVQSHAVILRLSFLAFASSLFGMPLITLLPVVAKETFGLQASGYGWLMTASGAGSVAGALLIAGKNRKRKGTLALICQLAFAAALLTFALSTNIWLSVIAVFCGGMFLLGVVTSISSLVQLATDEGMRGRVMSMFLLAFRGGMPLGSLFSGYVAERISPAAALSFNAVVLAMVATAFLVTSKQLREL